MKKNKSIFRSGDSNSDPNRETDKVCALDIKDYLSANMHASRRGEQISFKDRIKCTFKKKHA